MPNNPWYGDSSDTSKCDSLASATIPLQSAKEINIFYPNPVIGELSLYPAVASHYDRYAVHAVGGNTVMPEQNLRAEVIDVSQLDAGIYFLKLIADDRQVVKKFVKI